MPTSASHEGPDAAPAADRKRVARTSERASHGVEPPGGARAEQVLALQRRVGNRATARLLAVDGPPPPDRRAVARSVQFGVGASRAGADRQPAPPAREQVAGVQRVFSVKDPEGEVHADRDDAISEARLLIHEHLGAIEQADYEDFNGVYGNYLENGGVFDTYAQELFASGRDLGQLDTSTEAHAVSLYFALKELVMSDVVGEPVGYAGLMREHPEWAAVLSGIEPGQPDSAKLATLISNFKRNPMGFSYAAASKEWSLAGDCGSLVRTFMTIANDYLQVTPQVTRGFYNQNNGWYLPPGFSNIASNRTTPNVEGGGWMYRASHVWALWGGTVYDVLFGEVGQNGFEADESRYFEVGKSKEKAWHFRIGSQWYRMGDANNYIKTDDPTQLRRARTMF